MLILAQSAATSRAYAAKYNDRFDENVDLVGLGRRSVGGRVSGTFVVNGSPTKTQMVDGAGGRSQVAQVTTGVIVAIVLLFLTAPIQYMPKAVLASVVFLIGIELVDIAGMRKVLRAAAGRVRRRHADGRSPSSSSGRAGHRPRDRRSRSSTTSAGPTDPTTAVLSRPPAVLATGCPSTPDARSLPGLVVYRFAGTLYYANANLFFEQAAAFASAPEPLRWFCLDAAAIPDVDYSGGETIRQAPRRARRGWCQARSLSRVSSPQARASLERYGIIDLIGEGAVFDTMADVTRVRGAPDPRPRLREGVQPFSEAYEGRGAFASESRPPITTRFVPFARSLSGYSGARLRTDAVAGITVAALALPSAMAYAELAGAPVSAGLYALLLPVVAYALVRVGATGGHRARGHRGAARRDRDRSARREPAAPSTPRWQRCSPCWSGLVFFAARLIRLGWIADYFSQAVLVGYITGVAIVLILGQLGKLVGLSSDEDGAIREALDIVGHLGDANPATVAVGAVALALLIVLAAVSKRIPGALCSWSPASPRPGRSTSPPRRGRHRAGARAGCRRSPCPTCRVRTWAPRGGGRGHLPRRVLRLHPHRPLVRRPSPRGRRRQPGAARVRLRPGGRRASPRASRSARAALARRSTTTWAPPARSAGWPRRR